MRATHAPVEATPAKSRPAPPSAFRPRPPIQSSFDGVVLRRKDACACGGGCPTCQSASSSLKISEPDDASEREADRVAGEVMRMPDGAWGAHIGRFTEEDTLSRHAASPALLETEDDLSSVVAHGTSGGGHALDTGTRTFMESRFGRDFGAVRIHTGGAAEESARSIGAVAYTVGNNIVFGGGHYAPHTSEGRWLLSHELTHTIQQGSHTTSRIAHGAAPDVHTGSHGVVQRVVCSGKKPDDCYGKCVASGGGPGHCMWSGTMEHGCVCYPNPTSLSPALQFVYVLIMAALIAAAIVLTVEAIIAIIACLMGPCEIAALIALLGLATAMLVIGIIRSGGDGGSDAAPTTAAAEGKAPSEGAPA